MPAIEIVVAVRDEEETIPGFLDGIAALSLPEEVTLGVVFVEDSSSDGTLSLLRRRASEDSFVGYYSLAEGFGQCPALMFGLSRSRADAMIVMDADGGHPVEAIPLMIEGYLQGARVVQCVREELSDRRSYRRIGSAVYEALSRALAGSSVQDQLIYYRLVSSDVVAMLLDMPRTWHTLRFPLPREAGAVRKLSVRARERVLGESKYDFIRLAGFAIDGILTQAPPARLAVLLVGAVAATGLLALWAGWLVTVPALAALLWIAGRYRSLGRGDLLAKMHVVESANVPGPVPGR